MVWYSASALAPERQNRFQFHRAPRDQMLQRGPVKEFHHQERLAALFADVINRADVGMIQRRRGLGLTPKPFLRLPVFRQVFGQKLQRDEAAQPSVFRLVDDTHATAAELLERSGNERWSDRARKSTNPVVSHAKEEMRAGSCSRRSRRSQMEKGIITRSKLLAR